MPSSKKKVDYLNSDRGTIIADKLRLMVRDSSFNTGSYYTANTEDYPGHRIPFVDKHLRYLNEHQNINPEQYLANLRLMTRIR